MATGSKKITELSAKTALANNDLFLIVDVGNNVSKSANAITLKTYIAPVANSSTLGVIKVGSTLTINATGYVDIIVIDGGDSTSI
jgi:hypothetical protein